MSRHEGSRRDSPGGAEGDPRGVVEVVHSSVVRAPREEVWARVVTPGGVAHEFGPLLTMRFPAAFAEASIADVPTGRSAGRAWILLAGVLPLEFDDLTILEVSAPRFFRERSRLGSCRVWEHRRDLEALTDGTTRVTDTLRAVPRALLPRPVVRAVVGALFTHRHRRLARWADATSRARDPR